MTTKNETTSIVMLVCLVALYLVVAPGITLGYKYVFSTLDFHFPLTTVWTLFSFEFLMVAALKSFTWRSDLHNNYSHGSKWIPVSQRETSFSMGDDDDDDDDDDDASALLAFVQCRIFRRWSQLRLAGPVGALLAVEIGCSNLSLLTLSVAFHTMAKASTPVFVLLFSSLLGLEAPDGRLALTVVLIVAGVSLCSIGEVTFAVSGFLFVLVSCAAAGLRWVLSHLFLLRRVQDSRGKSAPGAVAEDRKGTAFSHLGPGAPPSLGGCRVDDERRSSGNIESEPETDSSSPLDAQRVWRALELLYWSLPVSIAVMPAFIVALELRPLARHLAAVEGSVLVEASRLLGAAVLFSVAALTLVIVELLLVAQLSSLSFTVLAAAKETLLVAISLAIFHDDKLGWLNWLGFATTIVGLATYRIVRQRKPHLPLPFGRSGRPPIEENNGQNHVQL